MTSRHTWRNAQRDLVILSNQELARLKRINIQQPKPTNTTMDDHENQDDLSAADAANHASARTSRSASSRTRRTAATAARCSDRREEPSA